MTNGHLSFKKSLIRSSFLSLQCSTSCGRGVQRRKITCQKIDKDGDAVDVEDGKCANFVKPNSEEYCNVHNPCPGDGKYIVICEFLEQETFVLNSFSPFSSHTRLVFNNALHCILFTRIHIKQDSVSIQSLSRP